jgi:hypothetical protein
MTAVEAWDELQVMILAAERGASVTLPWRIVAAMKKDMVQAAKVDAEFEAELREVEAEAVKAQEKRQYVPLSDVLQRVNLSGLFEHE